MDVILNFRIDDKKFVFYLENNKIYLSRVSEDVLLKISDTDKPKIKQIIEILSNNDFNIKSLNENNVVIIDKKGLNFQNQNNENSINIQFSDDKHNIFIDNCNKIYNESGKNKKGGKAKLLLLILPIIAILAIFVGLYFKYQNDKKEFLEKYTMVYTEEMADIEDLEYEFIEIKRQEITDNPIKSFNVEFDSPFPGYESIQKIDEGIIQMEIYGVNNSASMVVWMLSEDTININNLDNLDLYKNELHELGYTEVDFKEIFERYDINTKHDLIYYILKSIDINVDINSSKQEIIDKYVFDYLRPLVIPYNKESNTNKIYFFTGDSYGTASLTHKKTLIEFDIDDANGVRVAFEDEISKEDIIKVASTIKKQ